MAPLQSSINYPVAWKVLQPFPTLGDPWQHRWMQSLPWKAEDLNSECKKETSGKWWEVSKLPVPLYGESPLTESEQEGRCQRQRDRKRDGGGREREQLVMHSLTSPKWIREDKKREGGMQEMCPALARYVPLSPLRHLFGSMAMCHRWDIQQPSDTHAV